MDARLGGAPWVEAQHISSRKSVDPQARAYPISIYLRVIKVLLSWITVPDPNHHHMAVSRWFAFIVCLKGVVVEAPSNRQAPPAGLVGTFQAVQCLFHCYMAESCPS